MPFKNQKKKFSRYLMLSTLAAVSGCRHDEQASNLSQTSESNKEKSIVRALVEQSRNESRHDIREGIKSLLAGDYEKAGENFNKVLQEDPTNPWLHYLNGLRYHMMARNGEVGNFELAKAGYEQALKFDPNNVMASLQLGRVYSDQKEYTRARDEFANALLIQPANNDALYELACASYYLGDIRTARVAIERASKGTPNRPEIIKAKAIILAALGKHDKAEENLRSWKGLTQNEFQGKRLEGRIEDWRKLHETGLVLAQADTSTPSVGDEITNAAQPPSQTADTTAQNQAAGNGQGDSGTPAAQPQAQPAAATTPDVPGLGEMVTFDAVIMRISEEGITTKGHNIMDGFTMTLAPGSSIYARGSSSGAALVTGGPTTAGFTLGGTTANNASVTKMFARGISFGNISYSLNIANAERTRIEVVGRPSLITSVGKPSKFFSGHELTAGLSGDNGGNLVKTPIGIILEVVPVSIQDGKIKFDVTIYGSLLSNTEAEAVASTTDITKNWTSINISKINTSVEIGLGETILLGGITERIDEKGKTGFPILQDLPLIQYMFSQETTGSSRKSIMFLITPRTYESNKRAIQKADLTLRKPQVLTELERKNPDWFAPDFNQVVILRHLAPLYREFRHGDLDRLQWDMPYHLEAGLEQAASFFYY